MEKPSRSAIIGAAGLWVLTALLGFLVMGAIVQDILPRIFTLLGIGGPSYEVAYNLLVLLLGIVWIFVVVGGGEYHRTRIGRTRSWRLFAWTLGVEVAILLVAIVL